MVFASSQTTPLMRMSASLGARQQPRFAPCMAQTVPPKLDAKLLSL